MPSPAIATVPSLLLQLLDDVSLVVGKHSGLEVGNAQLARDGSGGGLAVSGEHDHAHALRAEESRTASGASGLMGSAMPSSPEARPSIATKTTVSPSRRRASARSLSSDALTFNSLEQAVVATATSWPPTMPITPLPVSERKPSGGINRRWSPRSVDDGAAQGMFAAALEAGRQATMLSSVSPATATTYCNSGLPCVSVPVLSSAMVVTFRRSRAPRRS